MRLWILGSPSFGALQLHWAIMTALSGHNEFADIES